MRDPERLGGFSTRAIHHGYNPLDYHGALNPPVFLTSTFAFSSRHETVQDGTFGIQKVVPGDNRDRPDVDRQFSLFTSPGFDLHQTQTHQQHRRRDAMRSALRLEASHATLFVLAPSGRTLKTFSLLRYDHPLQPRLGIIAARALVEKVISSAFDEENQKLLISLGLVL